LANEFLPFANGAAANVQDLTEYTNEPIRDVGFTKGLLLSPTTNRAWRQASFVAAGTAQAIADILLEDVFDNGDMARFVDQFIRALEAAAGAAVFIGPNPPLSPAPGDLWWDDDEAQLFVLYDDGNSLQWVIANHTAAPTILDGGTY